MSTVGIVSIVLGVIVVFGRGSLLLAPEEALRWFRSRGIGRGLPSKRRRQEPRAPRSATPGRHRVASAPARRR